MQRKLTDEELQRVMDARHFLRTVANFGGHSVYASIVLDGLDKMAKECTTDGKPYVEPQPEIGDGYRLATWADKDRRDLEFWSKAGGGWQHRKTIHGTPLDPDYHYRVPIDRIPTDEDARQRPTVMVRDNDQLPWQKQRLLAVAGSFDKFITSPGAELSACFWMQARFPYPGELD
jgi:hypothetical protein